jgi:hypothetical protein
MSRRAIAGALVSGAAAVALLLVPRLDRTPTPPISTDPCTRPTFVTSRNLTWDDGGFVVDQDMWNDRGGTQTLRACSYRTWSVTANQPDTPDVNAYPNVHRDLDAPSLTSFSEIWSRFATAGPGSGSYDFAYDVWLNGVAADGSTEVMVWTDTRATAPQVPHRGAFTSGGVRYAVYRGGRYVAFVGPDRATGEIDLLALLRYAVARGWLRPDSTLGQIDYGVEIRSTGGGSLDFAVTDFALTLG